MGEGRSGTKLQVMLEKCVRVFLLRVRIMVCIVPPQIGGGMIMLTVVWIIMLPHKTDDSQNNKPLCHQPLVCLKESAFG